ncbi:hypothetical protein LINGRAHAP2_LOCUS16909 [Linum grandiflorum]
MRVGLLLAPMDHFAALQRLLRLEVSFAMILVVL